MSKLLALITFELAAEPQRLEFHTISGDNPWRYLGEDTAVELVPVCDSLAQAVPKPPLSDRLEIWPVRQGFPASLIKDYPDEAEQLLLEYAWTQDVITFNLTWESWLNDHGPYRLWLRHRTPELDKHWLNSNNVLSDRSAVYMLPGTNEGSRNPTVRRDAIDGIRFRADYHLGEKFQTVYLAACIQSPLTTDERRHSPGHEAREV